MGVNSEVSFKYSNNLSDAELERLAYLAEECGEVIQVIGKIIRHGYESHNPFDPETKSNRTLLTMELTNVLQAMTRMKVNQDQPGLLIQEINYHNKNAWWHHQTEENK